MDGRSEGASELPIRLWGTAQSKTKMTLVHFVGYQKTAFDES